MSARKPSLSGYDGEEDYGYWEGPSDQIWGQDMTCDNCKCKELEERIAELEAFVEKAMANPMIAGMLS